MRGFTSRNDISGSSVFLGDTGIFLFSLGNRTIPLLAEMFSSCFFDRKKVYITNGITKADRIIARTPALV